MPDSNAPLIVLCNGLTNDGFQWRPLLRWLSTRNSHAVLMFDYRGHGCSENPRDVHRLTIRALADDMNTVLSDVSARHLSPTNNRITVLAYSMGCQVALEWCRGEMHRVCGVALILGTSERALDGLFGRRGASVAARCISSIGVPTLGYLFDVSTCFSYLCQRLSWAAARIAGVVRVRFNQFDGYFVHAKRMSGAAYVALVSSALHHRATDVLTRLDAQKIPLLIVNGGADVASPKSIGDAMHAAAPRSAYVHLPRACHAGMVSHAPEITHAVGIFLARTSSPSSSSRLDAAPAGRSAKALKRNSGGGGGRKKPKT